MFQVGEVIGSYTILAHLRTGGMASLFLARRVGAAGFARLVAIKVVHPRLSEDSNLIRMFVDEAKLTARIEHPNVVHVEELGELHGTYYIVMEYVHGCSIAQLMRSLGRSKRRLSPAVAVAICARVAEGLHAAHETTGDDGQLLGLVHRDVSPQNILLSHKGHVKLIDFGIAKAKMRREESNTKSLKGKVRYMAPEQATTGRIDRRADVYALGIVLWELLTMRRLFSGRTEFEILMQVRKPPKIAAPSRYATEIPPDLDAVVLRALAPDPELRFPNAKELRRALVRALPRAAGIDSAHIADLLVNVMAAALDHDRHELPDDISRVLRAEQLRVAGLEKDERASSVEIPLEVAPSVPIVEVYTLHSGELQFEDDESRPPDPTQRSERPPADMLAPRERDDEGQREVRVEPKAREDDAETRDDDSPTEVSDGLGAVRAAPIAAPEPSAPPASPAAPERPAPRASSGAFARYGVALGVSIALGVALALWGPSCDAAGAGAALPTTAAPPIAVAAPVPTQEARVASPIAPIAEPVDGAPLEAAGEARTTKLRGRTGRARPPTKRPTTSIVGGVPIARDLD